MIEYYENKDILYEKAADQAGEIVEKAKRETEGLFSKSEKCGKKNLRK